MCRFGRLIGNSTVRNGKYIWRRPIPTKQITFPTFISDAAGDDIKGFTTGANILARWMYSIIPLYCAGPCTLWPSVGIGSAPRKYTLSLVLTSGQCNCQCWIFGSFEDVNLGQTLRRILSCIDDKNRPARETPCANWT